MATVVVDTGLGNLRSVEKAVEAALSELGAHTGPVVRTDDPDTIASSDRIVVPGQGGFRDASQRLNGPLGEAIVERIRAGAPFLGICLGLQILFETSEEAPSERGLALLAGSVRRLEGGAGVKIPHMGWNRLELVDGGHPCLEACGGTGTWVYFVHSFHAVPTDEALLKAVATHGSNRVTAAVARDNVLATQFHPEKSQRAGLALLKSFLRL